MQQCAAWLRSIPIVTCFVVFVCFVIYIIELTQDESFMMRNAINPANVIENHQWGTFFSSAFFHGSFTHVLFNMLFMACQGGKVEQGMGTIAFLGVNLLLVCLTNLCYLGIASLLYVMSPDDFVGLYRHQYALGYSGILFGILVLDTQNTPDIDRIFCCCPIPAFLYPWVLFLVIQFAMPDISWLGHLSGILMGYLYAKGCLNWLTMPLEDIRACEASPSLTRLSSHARYAKVPDHSYISNCQYPCTSQWSGMLCKGQCFARCFNCCNSVGRNIQQGRDDLGARLGGGGNGYARVGGEQEGGRRLGDISADVESQQPGQYAAPVANARQPRPDGLNKIIDNAPRASESEKKRRQQQMESLARKAQAKAVNARMAAQASAAKVITQTQPVPASIQPVPASIPASIPVLAPPPGDIALTNINLNSIHETPESSDDDIYADDV